MKEEYRGFIVSVNREGIHGAYRATAWRDEEGFSSSLQRGSGAKANAIRQVKDEIDRRVSVAEAA